MTGYQGLRGFYGQFYVTLARYESRDAETFEKNLRRAVVHDPAAGRANVELSRLMDREGSYGAALDHLKKGMLTYRPVSTYLRLGRLLHRIGGRTQEAREALEAAVRMNPGLIQAMEQLALIAISQRDSSEVERWTDAIRNRDFGNLNAIYLRAMHAMHIGNETGARTLLQQLSALTHRSQELPPGTLFSKDEIRRRLEAAPSAGSKP